MHRLITKNPVNGSKLHVLLFPQKSDNGRFQSDAICAFSCCCLFPVAIFLPIYIAGFILTYNFGTVSVIIPPLAQETWTQIFSGKNGATTWALQNATRTLVYGQQIVLSSHLFHASLDPMEIYASSGTYSFSVPFFLNAFLDESAASILAKAYGTAPSFEYLRESASAAVALGVLIKMVYMTTCFLYVHQVAHSVYFPFSSNVWDRRAFVVSLVCTGFIFFGNFMSVGMDADIIRNVNKSLGAWGIKAIPVPYYMIIPWLLLFLAAGHTYYMYLIVFKFNNFRSHIDRVRFGIREGAYNTATVLNIYPEDDREEDPTHRPGTPPPLYSESREDDPMALQTPIARPEPAAILQSSRSSVELLSISENAALPPQYRKETLSERFEGYTKRFGKYVKAVQAKFHTAPPSYHF